MTNRERFRKTLRFEPVDHPPILLSGLWPATRKRWEAEGLTPGANQYQQFGVEAMGYAAVGLDTLFVPPFEYRVLEETDEFVVAIDRHGVKVRNFRDESSMPEHLEYPIKGPQDLEWLRQRLDATHPGRKRPAWLAEARQAQMADKLLFCNGGQYFALLNEHMGTEAAMYAYFDTPELVHEVNDLQCRCCEWALQQAMAQVQLDYVGYHEDMGYKTGAMISPAMFREFMTRYYQRVAKVVQAYEPTVHLMDSDGDIRQLIPLWLECGINCFTPLEAAAGMDVVALRREYGHRIGMHGGFDKRILAAGKDAIRAEIERLRPVIEEGGYLCSCDHLVPPDVSLENYRYFIDCLKVIHGL